MSDNLQQPNELTEIPNETVSFPALPRTYTESELKLERAAALREAAAECTRHAQFCKHEAENGGNREHLSARYAEANWNAQRILALIPSADASALDKLLAEARRQEAQTIRKEWHESQDFIAFGIWLTDRAAAEASTPKVGQGGNDGK